MVNCLILVAKNAVSSIACKLKLTAQPCFLVLNFHQEPYAYSVMFAKLSYTRSVRKVSKVSNLISFHQKIMPCQQSGFGRL